MPHQAAMLDDCNSPGVRECFWMIGSQLGKTMALILICEFVIKELRKSIIFARATRDTASEFMTEKFLPTIESTPCMRGLLVEPRKRGSNSTAMNRKFPGGNLKVIGAKSPAAFRGSSAGILLGDEIDTWQNTKEGDPMALFDRAAITFGANDYACKIKTSTPTLKGFSRVDAGYERSDKQKYFLPCPLCGGFQDLKFEQLKFSFTKDEYARFECETGRTENNVRGCGERNLDSKEKVEILGEATGGLSGRVSFSEIVNSNTWQIFDPAEKKNDALKIDTARALYVCEHCQHGWTDVQRLASYFSGHPDNAPVIVNGKELRAEWRATEPFTGIRGRQLSGMYLSIGLEKGMKNYLHWFAEWFLKSAKGGRESLMVWQNIFNALTFEDPHEKIDWKTIMDRAEDYGPELPPQAVWCNFGMDVHPDRVEIQSVGWGYAQECWALDYHVIWGDFDMPEMQERVADYLLKKRFNHPIMGELAFSAGCIDSGHQTKVKAVFQFTAKHAYSNFWAVKGFDSSLGSTYTRAKERSFGSNRYNLNVDYFKTMIFSRLKNTEHGANFIHFPKRFQPNFFMGICSERRVPIRDKKGGVRFEWHKNTSGTRNEPLDTLVYAFGANEIAKQDEWIARKWKEVETELAKQTPVAPVAAPVVLEPEPERKQPELIVRQPDRKTYLVKQPPRRRVVRVNNPFARRY